MKTQLSLASALLLLVAGCQTHRSHPEPAASVPPKPVSQPVIEEPSGAPKPAPSNPKPAVQKDTMLVDVLDAFVKVFDAKSTPDVKLNSTTTVVKSSIPLTKN